MSADSERLALSHALMACQAHEEPLREALNDLAKSNLSPKNLDRLSKDDRRLLDQFAYRYTRLQDDLGARLMPAVLKALGEDIAPMPVLDRINRLEQLNWLPSAQEWIDLRRIRNEFAHDYPEAVEDRHERLTLALEAAARLLEILKLFEARIDERFG